MGGGVNGGVGEVGSGGSMGERVGISISSSEVSGGSVGRGAGGVGGSSGAIGGGRETGWGACGVFPSIHSSSGVSAAIHSHSSSI